MSTFAALVTAEGTTPRELPMPTWLIGVLALLAFAFLLGLTWSFRGTHNKYAPPGAHGHDGAGAPAGHGAHGASVPVAQDQPHWPESPGHH
ncbi:hypothetical protein [Nostocoides sp. Soil756]|uniref:hypothetical protein n=1 Tax=Nostocoides sp. Soil756 TaxID=1736399 RepID=UPI0006FEAC93|nr:hypothetical protein [Tetrasphaera sp. Soil756]KRE61604.1 hypothetical protein ASG78_09625 [Tetrasphaera sp. Soil756]